MFIYGAYSGFSETFSLTGTFGKGFFLKKSSWSYSSSKRFFFGVVAFFAEVLGSVSFFLNKSSSSSSSSNRLAFFGLFFLTFGTTIPGSVCDKGDSLISGCLVSVGRGDPLLSYPILEGSF